MKPDYYQILGVTPQTSDKEIRRIYYKLAQKYHPDKARDDDEVRKFEEKFALISEAYNTLKDTNRRREYDKTRGIKSEWSTAKASETEQMKKSPIPTESAQGATNVRGAPRTERVSVGRRAFNKGLRVYRLKEYGHAIDFFEVALKNEPEEPRYYTYLALALVKSRQSISRAIDLCKKAIELQPYNPDTKLRLGEIYEIIGSTSLAKKTYEDVLHWDTSNVIARERLNALGFGQKEPKSIFVKLFNRFQKRKFY